MIQKSGVQITLFMSSFDLSVFMRFVNDNMIRNALQMMTI